MVEEKDQALTKGFGDAGQGDYGQRDPNTMGGNLHGEKNPRFQPQRHRYDLQE